jgi:hypothetical protein
MKGKALRRVLKTNSIVRLTGDVPLLTDETELITPTRAYELLEANKKNRPINWRRVEQYADIMKRGEWRVHGQGIMLDVHKNILTGQHRLWGVIYADVAVYMRVSRGNPPDVASVIDRGIPQSARDLASRETGRKHSPVEASIIRAFLAAGGVLKPSTDEIATMLRTHDSSVRALLAASQGTKKDRATIMLLGAILSVFQDVETITKYVGKLDTFVTRFGVRLAPLKPSSCWGRGASFNLAMRHAVDAVKEYGGM